MQKFLINIPDKTKEKLEKEAKLTGKSQAQVLLSVYNEHDDLISWREKAMQASWSRWYNVQCIKFNKYLYEEFPDMFTDLDGLTSDKLYSYLEDLYYLRLICYIYKNAKTLDDVYHRLYIFLLSDSHELQLANMNLFEYFTSDDIQTTQQKIKKLGKIFVANRFDECLNDIQGLSCYADSPAVYLINAYIISMGTVNLNLVADISLGQNVYLNGIHGCDKNIMKRFIAFKIIELYLNTKPTIDPLGSTFGRSLVDIIYKPKGALLEQAKSSKLPKISKLKTQCDTKRRENMSWPCKDINFVLNDLFDIVESSK